VSSPNDQGRPLGKGAPAVGKRQQHDADHDTADQGQDRNRHALSDQDRERLAELVGHARQHLRVSWTAVVTLAEEYEPKDYEGQPAGSAEWLEQALQWVVEQAAANDAPGYLLGAPFRLFEDGTEGTAAPADPDGLLAAAAYSLVSAAVLQDAAHRAAAEAVAALAVRRAL
jgi:hypothetical protein